MRDEIGVVGHGRRRVRTAVSAREGPVGVPRIGQGLDQPRAVPVPGRPIDTPIEIPGAGEPTPPPAPAREALVAGKRLGSVFAGDSRGFVLRRLLAISDVAALLVAWGATIGAIGLLGREPAFLSRPWVVGALLAIWLLIALATGLYHLPDRRLGHSIADEIGPIAFALTVWAWTLLIIRAAAESGPVEVLPSALLWITALVTVLGGRALTRVASHGRLWYRQRIAVVGTHADARQVIRRLRRHPELGVEVARVIEIEPNGDGRDPLHLLPDGSQNGELGVAREIAATLAEAAAKAGVSRVVIASSPGDMNGRSELIRTLSELHLHVDVVSADSDAIPPRGSFHYIEGLPLLTIPALQRTRSRAAAKRAFDLGAAAVLLTLFSPLLAYYMLRIKLGSPGPALFSQPRVGRDRRPFTMLKLRTMVSEADAIKAELEELNVHKLSETPGMFKIPGDPRVTRVGEKLRRWSLDELPQLWNVLRGEMSLVGPRPLVPEEAALVRGHYEQRFKELPGITGPWQTEGRSHIGFEDMLKLDYTYVVNWSVSQDLKLLLRTIGAVIRRHGAY